MTTSNKILDLIEQFRTEGKSFCIATILRTADSTSARPGAKAVIAVDGDLYGYVGGGCVTGAVRRGALEALKDNVPKMIRIKPKDDVVSLVDTDGVQLHKSSCPSGGTIEVFLEPMQSPRTLLICGASPIAQAVLPLAKGLGYRVIVAAMPEDHEKMPDASLYLENFEPETLNLTSNDSAIVMTQGKQDRNALRAVLSSSAGYKGMVCSRKKLKSLKETLVGETKEIEIGFANLHAPAGLHIGAIGPEEIAMAVMCEILAHHRQFVVKGKEISV
ncbi:MAG: XdhC family protein [Rhizobiaceae bacterium]|nr:XdhC family protein [Rhizobiaceae bacterium]